MMADEEQQTDSTRFVDWDEDSVEFEEPKAAPKEKRASERFVSEEADIEFARRTHIVEE